MNARQVFAGLGWSTTATVVMACCQFLFMAVLARLLDPIAFGLMAMAVIVVRFASFFAQMGFAQALIQKQHIDEHDTTAALLMSVAIGTVLCAGIALASPLFALLLRSAELAPVVGVLGLSLVFSAIGALPMALLRRQGRFKRIGAIEVFSYLIGYGLVGMLCAGRGLGVWSLVLATLGQQFLALLLAFVAVRFPLTWPVSRVAFRSLWNYGSRHSMVGFLEFLSANVESLFIGRYLGKSELGLFNRAITLTNLPVELGVSAVHKVLFPALSGMQNDRLRLADGFQMLLLGVGVFSSAIACGVAAAAPEIVELLLGPRWLASAPIVAVIAFAVPPMFMFVACGVTLDSLAVLGPKLRLQAGTLVLKVASVALLSAWGLTGIAVAVVLVELARLVLGLRLVGSLLGIQARVLWRLVAVFATTGATVWALVTLSASAGSAAGWPVAGRVALDCGAGALALSAITLWLVVSFPDYAPLRRFEAVRVWHARLLRSLRVQVLRP